MVSLKASLHNTATTYKALDKWMEAFKHRLFKKLHITTINSNAVFITFIIGKLAASKIFKLKKQIMIINERLIFIIHKVIYSEIFTKEVGFIIRTKKSAVLTCITSRRGWLPRQSQLIENPSVKKMNIQQGDQSRSPTS